MTFKVNWEKTNQTVQIKPDDLFAMVKLAYPNHTLLAHNLISGGCANINVRIQLSEESHPLILRIYLRDQDSVYKEQNIANLIGDTIPIPKLFFIGDWKKYRFAITEYKRGITLRDLLLKQGFEVAKEVLIEIGLALASLQKYHFSSSGFFNRNLDVTTPISQNDYVNFTMESLEYPTTKANVNKKTISKLKAHVMNSKSLFPDETIKHLVHGDFGPENILIEKREGQWKLSTVLDWEFAFSGSSLCDVANMLRYSHQLPPIFKDSFLEGVKQGGLKLPKNWQARIALLNLLSLLDCLNRCPIKNRPNQCADICDLIAHITQQLELNVS